MQTQIRTLCGGHTRSFFQLLCYCVFVCRAWSCVESSPCRWKTWCLCGIKDSPCHPAKSPCYNTSSWLILRTHSDEHTQIHTHTHTHTDIRWNPYKLPTSYCLQVFVSHTHIDDIECIIVPWSQSHLYLTVLLHLPNKIHPRYSENFFIMSSCFFQVDTFIFAHINVD